MDGIDWKWRVEGAAESTDAPLVLALHGQGMTGDDLARVFTPLFTLPVRFLLPTAPLESVGARYPGPSWYHYDGDAQRFQAELGRTEEQLLGFLEQVETALHWKPRARVLFGFSQGGYCGAYVALNNSATFGGLVVSGARVKVEILGDAIARAAQSPFEVLLCHGRRDRHVSIEAAQSSYEGLTAAGLAVTLRIFDGGHSMGADQVETIRSWLQRHLQRR